MNNNSYIMIDFIDIISYYLTFRNIF